MPPTRLNLTVVPANPGQYVVWKDTDGTLFADEPVIAYRVETLQRSDDAIYSHVDAITADGDAVGNAVGVLNSDGSVTLFALTTSESLKAAEEFLRENGL